MILDLNRSYCTERINAAGERMISNIPEHRRGLAEQAATTTHTPVRIDERAVDNRGKQVEGYIALWWTSQLPERDTHDFWEEYRRLEAIAKAQEQAGQANGLASDMARRQP